MKVFRGQPGAIRPFFTGLLYRYILRVPRAQENREEAVGVRTAGQSTKGKVETLIVNT